MGTSNPQLVIRYPIGDWGFLSQVKRVGEKIPNPLLDIISPIGDLNYPIEDIMPNWVFSFVSPVMRHYNKSGML